MKLPPEVLGAIHKHAAGWSAPGATMTTPEQWHLTLQFLGNDADVIAAESALRDFDGPGGRVQLGGTGAFPNTRRGTVLWIGICEGADVLGATHRGVAATWRRSATSPTPRPFRPHVTFARCATDGSPGVNHALGPQPIGSSWPVSTLTVYESELRPEGRTLHRPTSVPLTT